MVLGNVREQCQSLKGSCERREHERESEQHEQERRAGSRSRSVRSRSREQEAKGAQVRSGQREQGAVGARGAGAGSRERREHKCKEQGAARCAHAIGAITMLVAVRSAVEQALHRY